MHAIEGGSYSTVASSALPQYLITETSDITSVMPWQQQHIIHFNAAGSSIFQQAIQWCALSVTAGCSTPVQQCAALPARMPATAAAKW